MFPPAARSLEHRADRVITRRERDAESRLLRQMGWTGLIYGVLIIVFAALLGDHRWAVTIRRTVAQTSNWLVAGGVGAVLLILFWWSPGRALDRWVTALTLVGLLIGAGVALTRRIRDDFPGEASMR